MYVNFFFTRMISTLKYKCPPRANAYGKTKQSKTSSCDRLIWLFGVLYTLYHILNYCWKFHQQFRFTWVWVFTSFHHHFRIMRACITKHGHSMSVLKIRYFVYLSIYLSIFREVQILFRSKLPSIVVLSAVQRCASTGTQNLWPVQTKQGAEDWRSASKNGHNHISRGTAAWVGSWRPLRTGPIQLKPEEHSIHRPHLGRSCIGRLGFCNAVVWIGIGGPWWCR